VLSGRGGKAVLGRWHPAPPVQTCIGWHYRYRRVKHEPERRSETDSATVTDAKSIDLLLNAVPHCAKHRSFARRVHLVKPRISTSPNALASDQNGQ